MPIARTSSGLVPREAFNVGFPSTDIVNLPDWVPPDSDGGQGLVARFPSSDDDDEPLAANPKKLEPKPNSITIPPEFLPTGSTPVSMTMPTPRNLSGLGSMLHIFNMIKAAANCDPSRQLDTPRDTFKTGLENKLGDGLDALMADLKNKRPTAINLDENSNLSLEELRNSIEKAIKVPEGFLVGNLVLAIKIPYPDREEAIASLHNIFKLMRSATVNNPRLSQRLSYFRVALSKQRFKIDNIFTSRGRKDTLHGNELSIIQQYIEKMVKRHNAGGWMKEEDIDKWRQDMGPSDNTRSNEDSSTQEVPQERRDRRSIQIPNFFIMPDRLKTKSKKMHMNVPPSSDKDGQESVNRILTLMAAVDCTRLKRGWEVFRNKLRDTYGLTLMEWPETLEASEDTEEDRKMKVMTAITEHNARQKVYNQKHPTTRVAEERPGGDTSRKRARGDGHKAAEAEAEAPQSQEKERTGGSAPLPAGGLPSNSAHIVEPPHLEQHEGLYLQGTSTLQPSVSLPHTASGDRSESPYDPVRAAAKANDQLHPASGAQLGRPT
ncbi:hypothetical protein H0H93_000943 [Arthromyces matolae]|nr:hypothetical protein H0H93_000943 [Arthromyces matolae]